VPGGKVEGVPRIISTAVTNCIVGIFMFAFSVLDKAFLFSKINPDSRWIWIVPGGVAASTSCEDNAKACLKDTIVMA
jgi:hypothetical protein